MKSAVMHCVPVADQLLTAVSVHSPSQSPGWAELQPCSQAATATDGGVRLLLHMMGKGPVTFINNLTDSTN